MVPRCPLDSEQCPHLTLKALHEEPHLPLQVLICHVLHPLVFAHACLALSYWAFASAFPPPECLSASQKDGSWDLLPASIKVIYFPNLILVIK